MRPRSPHLPLAVCGTALWLLTPLAAQQGRDPEGDACTSILVSRGATTDGSTMITYSADAPFLPKLLHIEGGTHAPGAMVDVSGWEDDEVRGRIPQAPVTYRVVGLINEHQLALGETTTGGRRELRNREGLLDYDALMWLTLQRARTAREAIDTIVALCDAHGYGSSGETIAIADPDEVWVMEIIGRGPGSKGILWVAARVPDGCITASANMARITTFPRDDPENWRFAADVEQFAIDRGYHDPATDGQFSWRDAYHPDPGARSKRACATRVWSIYRRCKPGVEWPTAWHRGVEGAEDYPLFVQPDAKLSAQDVMALMRDHYEGTPFDMTQGLAAGPFASPYRFRGLTFELDGAEYCWERPISTQQAGFVMLAQCRGWLPDPVGGIYWFTPDDCYTSCFVPLYCGIAALPAAYTRGDYGRFEWDSSWWLFNFVSNLCYDRWSRVAPEVLAAQRRHEDDFVTRQRDVDAKANSLAGDPEALRRYLTATATEGADRLVEGWQELAVRIVATHVDGYVKQDGRSRGVGYDETWLRRVVAEQGGALRLPQESAPAQGATPAAGAGGPQDAAAGQETAADREQELRKKERELRYARREVDTAAIDAQARTATVRLALDEARFGLDKARHELGVFRSVQRPKELEQRRISHQQHVYAAEHAKDELQELEEMYRAEEFAKATKELVLERGRRSLELAQRNLAVSATELELLEEHTLPQQEAEMQRKVAAGEVALHKAELDAQKAAIELELAASRARDKVEDLEREIGRLKEQGAASGGAVRAGGAQESR